MTNDEIIEAIVVATNGKVNDIRLKVHKDDIIKYIKEELRV